MNSLFDLSGKCAFITGASSGLGVQFAKVLAQSGASVVLAARRIDRLEAVRAEIASLGKKVMAVKCDVTSETDIARAVAEAVKVMGRIDILVNNAGVSAISPAQNMSENDWGKVLDTNLKGVFLVAKHVGRQMITQHSGSIINISSMYGLVGNTAFPVVNYHAAKSGVIGLTKALAAEWAHYGLRVNALAPGFFESEMTQSAVNTSEFKAYVEAFCPMKRIGKEGELNGALIYLASDTSTYMTGQVIAVDGGWTAV